ncbi:hypothetical protein ACWZHB_10785 [Nocardia sp. FBN12]|uniref:hypothetical protein n=1 Tax=Nocardia sp. FBN12 TaxID=3419766 RepID=UPI003D020EA7
MTVSVLFELIAAGHLVLACLCMRWLARTGNKLLIIPMLLCLALLYDNAVIGAGRVIGAGEVLELVSVPRFAVHAVLTPLLIVWARAAADRAGVAWAGSRPAVATTWVLTVCSIGLALVNDVAGLSLQAQQWAGTLRYSNIPTPDSEALPVIITGVFVLVIGVGIWIRRRYSPLMITASIMTVAASLAASSPLLGNLGELILAAGLVGTAHWLARLPQTPPVPAGPITRLARRLGWIAFPLLIATSTIPTTEASTGNDLLAVAQAVYQVLLIIHAQLGITIYGLPPRGNRLRRFHTGFGYANIPLLAAGQLSALFSTTTGLAEFCTQALLITITAHVGIGTVFALRRKRSGPGLAITTQRGRSHPLPVTPH